MAIFSSQTASSLYLNYINSTSIDPTYHEKSLSTIPDHDAQIGISIPTYLEIHPAHEMTYPAINNEANGELKE